MPLWSKYIYVHNNICNHGEGPRDGLISKRGAGIQVPTISS